MTRDEWAKKLHNREYRSELSEEEEAQAKADGVLIVFGASDDLMEFRGVIYDEAGVYDGGTVLVNRGKLFEEHDDCDCKYCGYEQACKTAAKIKAVWCGENDYSWTYKTSLPHSRFDIVEDGEKYCRGIVVSGDDLPE